MFVLLIALFAIGTVPAQNWRNPWGAAQSRTVNGTLQLQNGLIAVQDGTAIYFVPMLERYIGFIEGLKEGSRISIEGYVSGNYIEPLKITINGKSYDFLANGYGPGRGYGHCRGWCWG
jgi:hypothetical protein